MRILVINPGGTSTKVAVFDDEQVVMKENIKHTQESLEGYPTVFDQFELRKSLIEECLKNHHISCNDFAAVVGRGGLMKPIAGGVYAVNEQMIDDLREQINGEHASNLGAVLAKAFGEELGIPSYIVDPVSTDEFMDISRITGLSDIVKYSWLHPLNHKAVCRRVAKEMGGAYEDFNFIVAHLGSGNSFAAHAKGQMIDGSGGRSDGPFSPERSGGILTYPLIELCYSGKYNREEMVNKVSNVGGFYDYLGTKDMLEIEGRIEHGDEKAKLVMEAYIYQCAKEICSYAAAFSGQVDRIIITGGIGHSVMVTEGIRSRVEFLAPVVIVAGELEMEAMAAGACRALTGEVDVKTYQ